jgi:two-component system NtrC family response regulator
MESDSQIPNKKPRLLIVEDDESIRTQMKWALAQQYEIFTAGDRAGAMEIIKQESPEVVTLDLGLPPHPTGVTEGFSTLADILAEEKLTKVIIITGQGEKNNALKAVAEGAYDFFQKPIEIGELKIVLGRAFYLSRLEREHRALLQNAEKEAFEGMLGASPQMESVFTAIRKVATTDASVLILGESGTGKELVARAIHKLSARNGGPLVVINCGAIPENLLESELFGHEKGAFTGAHIQRKGRIEAARGGTLFLDEIGDLSLPLQVKILRYLQEQKIERIGGREEISIDSRVLAATNSDLKQAIKEGRFREDLFYRLSVVTIALPPLRERGDDILLLANAFLIRFAREYGKNIAGFHQRAADALVHHFWEGNIRELENRIKRAAIMAEGKKITPTDLELDSSFVEYKGLGLKGAREALERDFIQRALARCRGNMTRVAEELGISRPTLYELMEKLKIARNF